MEHFHRYYLSSNKILIYPCIIFYFSENICIDIKVVTKAYGRENSWTFGACSSAQEYQTSTTTNEQCCQPAGNYELVCKDSHGDGWHGGYLEISGQEHCKEFTTGKEKKEDATMANGNRSFSLHFHCFIIY